MSGHLFTSPHAARTVGLASLGAALTGCGLGEAIGDIGSSYQTERFEPTQAATVDALLHRDEGGLFCGINRRGLASDLIVPGTDGGEVLVGYDNFDDIGRCGERILHTFRGGVRFDLSSLPAESGNALLVAELTFRRDPAPHDNTVEPCDEGFREVRVATIDWEPGYHRIERGERLANIHSRRAGIACTLQPDGVTHECLASRAVRTWVAGDDQNFGFVLLEKEPDLPEFDPDFGEGVIYTADTTCAHYYDNFELEVDYVVPS